MPQGPLLSFDVNSGGVRASKNVSTTGVIKATPGQLSKISVIAPGSAGSLSVSDCSTVGAAAAGNLIYTAAFSSLTAGQTIALNWPCYYGITVSAVPSSVSAAEAVTSMTWATTNGGQVAVVMTGASIANLGDTITVSGVTNDGSGNVNLINTNQVINTWTNTTHFTFLLPGTALIWGNLAGTITLTVNDAPAFAIAWE